MSPHCGTGVSLDLLNDSHLSSAQGLHLVNLRIVAFSDSLQKFIVSLRTGDHRFLYHFLKDEAFFFFFFLFFNSFLNSSMFYLFASTPNYIRRAGLLPYFITVINLEAESL